jgi:site-specific recombinase XerD
MRHRIKYESFLSQEIENYLVYRKKTGFTDDGNRWFFSTLDRFIRQRNASLEELTPAFLLEFRNTLDVNPGTVNKIFIHLRGFFDYLVRMDYMAKNPARDIPRAPERAYIPFVFSPEQTDALLKAVQHNIRKKDEYDFLKNLAVYTAVMLMAA